MDDTERLIAIDNEATEDLHTDGEVINPLATMAGLDSSVFEKINATDIMPKTWEERARKAWEYYLQEPLVNNCVNTWRIFAVGDEIKVTSDDERVKEEVAEFAERVRLSTFVKDMLLQLLVKGDAVGFRRYAKDGKDLEELVSVNPTSIKVKYVRGQLMDVKQYAEETPGMGEGLDLPVEQVLHLKWNAPGFSSRGNSMVLPAFRSIALLQDYLLAEQAIAKRWATPFRLLKVGGAYGQKMVMPDQKMLEQVRNMANQMDLKSGLVVPFYVTVETHGTEGQVLKVEDKVKEVKEDIMVALGLSRSLVTGDGPNFATASVSLQKMLVMIREIKHAARTILDWVLDDWLELHGFEGKTLQYLFNDLDPSDAVEIKRILIELYDREVLSRSSLQLKMDLDPDIEVANRKREKSEINLRDEKQVKPIVDMVMAGIMSVEQAQEMLGIVPNVNAPETHSEASWGDFYTVGATTGALCDECAHFDEEHNLCRVHHAETTFDTRACRYFNRRISTSRVSCRKCGS